MSKKELTKHIYNKLALRNPKAWFKFIDLNRRILADVCDRCRVMIVKKVKRGRMQSNIDPSMFCDKCKPGVEAKLEKIKEIIEGV